MLAVTFLGIVGVTLLLIAYFIEIYFEKSKLDKKIIKFEKYKK